MGFMAAIPILKSVAAKFAPQLAAGAKRIGGKLLSKVTAKRAAGVVAAGAGFEVGGRLVRGGGQGAMRGLIDPRTGKPFPRRKRHGLSASDIRGAQKVARLVRAFGYKPKIKPRRRGR